MQIKELRLNIQFEYIREIRKYAYDIEELLRKNNLCDVLNPVPPIPDDFEPQIERLSTIKTEENKTVNIFISQASISILFVYITPLNIEDCFEKDLEYMSNISKDIKSLLKDKNSTFKVNFEGLIVATSETILKNNISLINKLSLDDGIEEDRKKITREIDSKHFEGIEKSAVKFYTDIIPNINIMSIKNNKDNFVGWNYILVLEINNRLEYHNSKDEDLMNMELDLAFAYAKINDILEKEAI